MSRKFTNADSLQAGSAIDSPPTVHFSTFHRPLAQEFSYHDIQISTQFAYANYSFGVFAPNVTITASNPLPTDRLPSANEHPLFYVGVFGCIGIGVVLVNILGQVILSIGAYRASKQMFTDLLNKVMRATMRWFDTTPTGKHPLNDIFLY